MGDLLMQIHNKRLFAKIFHWTSLVVVSVLGAEGILPSHETRFILASELNVESQLDQSPAELKALNESALLLEKRFNELEQRLKSEQDKIASAEQDLVELSLSLLPETGQKQPNQDSKILVSHLRMSVNGRPHVYNQDAVLTSGQFPIPLYLGLIKAGKHLVRLQFQATQYKNVSQPASQRSWVKMDETFTIDVDPESSRSISKYVYITPGEGRFRVSLQENKK